MDLNKRKLRKQRSLIMSLRPCKYWACEQCQSPFDDLSSLQDQQYNCTSCHQVCDKLDSIRLGCSLHPDQSVCVNCYQGENNNLKINLSNHNSNSNSYSNSPMSKPDMYIIDENQEIQYNHKTHKQSQFVV